MTYLVLSVNIILTWVDEYVIRLWNSKLYDVILMSLIMEDVGTHIRRLVCLSAYDLVPQILDIQMSI